MTLAASPPRFPGPMPDGSIVLPNQWSLNPAGKHLELGDFPVNIALHPGGRCAAILHCGFGTHEVVVVNLKSRAVVSRVTIPESFYGVCFSPDGSRLFASGGEFDVVHCWNVGRDGLLSEHKSIRIVPQKESFVAAGVSVNPSTSDLYVCGAWGGRLAILPGNGDGPPAFIEFEKDSYPYLAIPSADGARLFVSLWGGSSVAVVNLARRNIEARCPTPPHPTEMALSPDGSILYVACANSNLVAVIDTSTGRSLETIGSALYPSAPNGSTPNSLALLRDGSILLVANADNNNIAVINVSERGKARSLGFISTGWYPTSVRFDAAGNILVASGKGLSSRANRDGPKPGIAQHNIRQYIGSLFNGALSCIEFPAPRVLAQYTAQAYKCSPLREDSAVVVKPREKDNPIPATPGAATPIKHCIYVIKENRTYDQILGDMPQGNGDPSICLFPEKVTPNHHALARTSFSSITFTSKVK